MKATYSCQEISPHGTRGTAQLGLFLHGSEPLGVERYKLARLYLSHCSVYIYGAN